MSHIQSHIQSRTSSCPQPSSPLVLADGLIALAMDADCAGQQHTALCLIELAYGVLDQQHEQLAAA